MPKNRLVLPCLHNTFSTLLSLIYFLCCMCSSLMQHQHYGMAYTSHHQKRMGQKNARGLGNILPSFVVYFGGRKKETRNLTLFSSLLLVYFAYTFCVQFNNVNLNNFVWFPLLCRVFVCKRHDFLQLNGHSSVHVQPRNHECQLTPYLQ